MTRSCISALCWLAIASAALDASAATQLIMFTSPSCGPCRQMRPILARLHNGGHAVREIDVSARADVAAQFHVTSWPTFIVLVDGQERARLEGATSEGQLVEMIRTATAIGESKRRQKLGGAAERDAAINFAADGSPFAASPATFAAGPAPGRIVEINEPFFPAGGSQPRPTGSPAAASNNQQPAGQPLAQPALAAPSPSHAPQDAQLLAATVRLSIADPDGKSTGAGVVIDARGGEALVLTCGHLFRSSGGKSPIEISLFGVGPRGIEVRQTAEGVLMHYDLSRDLAVVRFKTDVPPSVLPVAPSGTPVTSGTQVATVGCDEGDPPTVWRTQITAVDRYQGFPNVEAARAPVEGRSGGPLINSQGQVIGICYAADPQRDEGLYASLPSIHDKLDELQLSVVYREPAGVGPAPSAIAAAPAAGPQAGGPLAVRGQDPAPTAASDFTGTWPAVNASSAPLAASPGAASAAAQVAEATSTAPSAAQPGVAPVAAPTPLGELTADDRIALDEIGRRAADSEVICIIRPRTPDGRSDVIKLNNVSPAFVRAIMASQPAGAIAATYQR